MESPPAGPLFARARLEGRRCDPGAAGPTRRSRRCSAPSRPDVKAGKRSLSTIARRLDTLGAMTRGQRQTGGQGLFRPEDNLESQYGRDALRQLYLC